MTRSALLLQSEIARNRAEVLAWLDKEGRDAPEAQWQAMLDVIRHFRPAYRDGYVHHGVTLHDVLD